MSEYRPSMSEACKAKCFDCTANFADGRRDCLVKDCPVYIRMPYRRTNGINFDWVFGRWSRSITAEAEKLGITNPLEFAKHKWGSSLLVVGSVLLSGKIKIPISKIIRAKCFRCSANFIQPGPEKGRVDCNVTSCPFYYWTPYRSHEPDLSWMFDLDYTKKHRLAISALGYDQETYLHHLLELKDL